MGRKWANIVAKKTAKDGATSKVYAKFGVEIYAAAKQGEPDPESNSSLKFVIERAKQAQVPKHVIDKAIDKADVKQVRLNNRLGILSWGLSRSLPVFVMLVFGEGLVNLMLNYIPAWLTNGLATAGGLLPAVGIAILLRYLPVKNYITYLIVGFVAVAYLSVPMFGVALIGLGLALKAFKDTIKEQNQNQQQTVVYSANMSGGLQDGEYED